MLNSIIESYQWCSYWRYRTDTYHHPLATWCTSNGLMKSFVVLSKYIRGTLTVLVQHIDDLSPCPLSLQCGSSSRIKFLICIEGRSMASSISGLNHALNQIAEVRKYIFHVTYYLDSWKTLKQLTNLGRRKARPQTMFQFANLWSMASDQRSKGQIYAMAWTSNLMALLFQGTTRLQG